MSELDDPIARLERAVARLEAASQKPVVAGAARDAMPDADETARVVAVAAAIAAHVDAALARLDRLLEREG